MIVKFRGTHVYQFKRWMCKDFYKYWRYRISEKHQVNMNRYNKNKFI